MTASLTAFDAHRRIASGSLPTVALVVKAAADRGAAGPVLVFDDRTGRQVEIDTRGTPQEVLDRLPLQAPADDAPAETGPRGRGRPRLGVVAREVTLLPRHWDWLNAQRGGASVALRQLVDAARRDDAGQAAARQAQEAAYQFMLAIAGDLPGYEEATRALFAADPARFKVCIAGWPQDVAAHALKLAFPEPA
jgi:hypothetical protein